MTGGKQQCRGVSVGSTGKHTGFTVTKRTYITMLFTPWSCFTAHTANFHPTLRCEQCKPPTILTRGSFLSEDPSKENLFLRWGGLIIKFWEHSHDSILVLLQRVCVYGSCCRAQRQEGHHAELKRASPARSAVRGPPLENPRNSIPFAL